MARKPKSPVAGEPNYLYYGNNLDILRLHVAQESVDLVYLDPPFKSDQNYNVLFQERDGSRSVSQHAAFDDTWKWDKVAAATYQEVVERGGKVAQAMLAFRTFLGESDMLAYLTMMAPRLVELRRVLKDTGSIYLHCDPTASHYLKMLMDAVFGPQQFKNEIVWRRTDAHNDPKKYGNVHDTILFYGRSSKHTWNPQYTPYSQDYLDSEWRLLPSGRYYKSENMLDPRGSMKEYDFKGTVARWRTNHDGMMELWNASQTEVPNSHGRIKLGKNGKPIKRCRIMFLDEMSGVPLQTWWGNIPSLRGGARERLGYPTQKPEALLERIIQASSSEGDTVLDPFCGCGTTIAAAQKLNRRWIGIDITYLAIVVIRKRMQDAFGDIGFKVIGEPTSLPDAQQLAEQNHYQFQWWVLDRVNARPIEQKKGADRGIDGRLYFHDEGEGGATKQVIFSVKAGENISVRDVRDLRGVIDREKAAIGVLLTMQEPTRPMRTEASSAGFYHSPYTGKNHPRLQLLTAADLFAGKTVDMPPIRHTDQTFKRASRARPQGRKNLELDF